MTRALLVVLFAASACDHGAADSATPGVCPATCDDRDPCTDDRCDPTTGACVHVPRDVTEACRQDDHCDDGDPCTTDTCGVDVQCRGLERCRHERVTGCRSCTVFAGECDDGNPCTVDTCGDDLLCSARVEEGCDARCDLRSFSSPSFVVVGAVSIRAELTPSASCTDGCPCTTGAELADEGGRIDTHFDGASCDRDASCQVSCTPVAYGRYALFYGEASDARTRRKAALPGIPGEPEVPVQLADTFTVEGWCMWLDASGLDGDYDATLVLDGQASAITFSLQFNALQPIVTAQQRIDFSGSYPYSEDAASLTLPFLLDGNWVSARLFPGRDRLQGLVYDQSFFFADGVPDEDAGVPPPPDPRGHPIGRLTLVLR